MLLPSFPLRGPSRVQPTPFCPQPPQTQGQQSLPQAFLAPAWMLGEQGCQLHDPWAVLDAGLRLSPASKWGAVPSTALFQFGARALGPGVCSLLPLWRALPLLIPSPAPFLAPVFFFFFFFFSFLFLYWDLSCCDQRPGFCTKQAESCSPAHWLGGRSSKVQEPQSLQL